MLEPTAGHHGYGLSTVAPGAVGSEGGNDHAVVQASAKRGKQKECNLHLVTELKRA